MAEKALKNHFEKNNVKAILIRQRPEGDFVFESFEEPIKVVTETELNNLIKSITNE